MKADLRVEERAMVDGGIAPIVVGVDGSAAGVAALGWGADEAARRGCELEAIVVTETENTETENTETLQQVQAVAARYPAVRMRYIRTVGAPARALVVAARGAAMLVVGSHGHGRLAGALLGSVSACCSAHAGCPVVVVPEPDRVAAVTEVSDVDVLATRGPLL